MQATLCTVPGCPDPLMIRWLPVSGYEGIYEVHSHSDVRRVGRGAGTGGGARIGRILKPHEVPGHYLIVQLWRDGKPKMRLVHLLVAAAFIGECPEGKEVNHKNGNKRTNCAGNLEYVTRSENIRHAYRTGLHSVNVEPMVSVRRKPRVAVECECGCGTTIETPDSKGRDRRYVHGHGNRKRAAS